MTGRSLLWSKGSLIVMIKKSSKVFKEKFVCNGTVIEHPKYGEVIQVQVIRARTYAISLQRWDWLRTSREGSWI